MNKKDGGLKTIFYLFQPRQTASHTKHPRTCTRHRQSRTLFIKIRALQNQAEREMSSHTSNLRNFSISLCLRSSIAACLGLFASHLPLRCLNSYKDVRVGVQDYGRERVQKLWGPNTFQRSGSRSQWNNIFITKISSASNPTHWREILQISNSLSQIR